MSNKIEERIKYPDIKNEIRKVTNSFTACQPVCSVDEAYKNIEEIFINMRRQTLQEVLDSAPKDKLADDGLTSEIYNQAISDFKQIITNLIKK